MPSAARIAPTRASTRPSGHIGIRGSILHCVHGWGSSSIEQGHEPTGQGHGTLGTLIAPTQAASPAKCWAAFLRALRCWFSRLFVVVDSVVSAWCLLSLLRPMLQSMDGFLFPPSLSVVCLLRNHGVCACVRVCASGCLAVVIRCHRSRRRESLPLVVIPPPPSPLRCVDACARIQPFLQDTLCACTAIGGIQWPCATSEHLV